MQQLDSHWTDCDYIWYLSLFQKPVDQIQILLKSDKSKEYFTWKLFHIYNNISLNSFKNEKYFRQICGENQNIYIMFDFFQKSCCLWDNVEECGEARKVTKDDTLWRMRVK